MIDYNTAQGQPIPPPPNNYLAESILVTLFCCILFAGTLSRSPRGITQRLEMVQMGISYPSIDVSISLHIFYYDAYRGFLLTNLLKKYLALN